MASRDSDCFSIGSTQAPSRLHPAHCCTPAAQSLDLELARSLGTGTCSGKVLESSGKGSDSGSEAVREQRDSGTVRLSALHLLQAAGT